MNAEAVRDFLTGQLGDALVGAFVYGSVAAGRAHPDSDIDCFVVTAADLLPTELHALSTQFAELQIRFGYRPDPEYPIEIFSIAACRALLNSDLLAQAVENASTGSLDASTAASDAVEVLRALLDHRITLRGSPELAELSLMADAVIAAGPGPVTVLQRALKVADAVRS